MNEQSSIILILLLDAWDSWCIPQSTIFLGMWRVWTDDRQTFVGTLCCQIGKVDSHRGAWPDGWADWRVRGYVFRMLLAVTQTRRVRLATSFVSLGRPEKMCKLLFLEKIAPLSEGENRHEHGFKKRPKFSVSSGRTFQFQIFVN